MQAEVCEFKDSQIYIEILSQNGRKEGRKKEAKKPKYQVQFGELGVWLVAYFTGFGFCCLF